MKYFKNLISSLLIASLCLTNITVVANTSDKEAVQEYFETKSPDERETTEIIVSFSSEITSSVIGDIVQNAIKEKLNLSGKISDVGIMKNDMLNANTTIKKVLSDNTVLLKTNDADATLEALNNNDNIIYAQPNYHLYTATAELNNKLWAIENNGQVINGTQGKENADLNVSAAWNITQGSDEVIVAVLDTGIDIGHPALQGNVWENSDEQTNGTDSDNNGYVDDVNGWDFVNNDSSVFDNASIDEHGTHIAGIIAANGENGVYGIAPNVKIMPLKVMEDNSGYTSDIIEAINYAEANGAKIANCSFSGLEYNPALEDAISKSNMLFVTATGNYASSTADVVSFPASYDCENIISVGAVDNSGNIAELSPYGDLVNVYAPGIGIYSTLPNGKYDFQDGTSCSAAYVSGIAALLYSEYPELTPKQAKEALCTEVYNETETLDLNNSVDMINAENVLNFDFVNAKSAMPEVIDLSENTAEKDDLYPFSFYDESNTKFALKSENFSNASLSINALPENENAENVFYADISINNSTIDVLNIANDTEYNFALTYTVGATVYNYYGKLKKSFLEEENKYITESYDIVNNNYEQNPIVAANNLNDDIALLSTVSESESNNTIGTADKISSDDDVYGTISSASDIDWYKITFSSSGVANFWLGNVPSGCNYQLQLYNSSGALLTGSYNASGLQELISFYSVSATTYYIKIYTASGYSTSQYLFRAKWYPSSDSYESNNTFSTATTLSNNSTLKANINHPDDVDFYKFTLSSKSYVELTLSGIPSNCKYNIELFSGPYDSDSYWLFGDYTADKIKQNNRILTAGTYYVKIYTYNNAYSATKYSLSLNYCPVKSMTLGGSISGSLGSLYEMMAYTFSTSSQCGVKIDLSGVTSTDFDMYLYKVSGSLMTETAVGDKTAKTGESVSATLSSGDYILIVKRYSGSESAFTLSSSKTTTSNSAQITLSGFPTNMTVGSTKAVTITVKNLGMNTWTKADGYKLSCLNDAASFMSSELNFNTSDEIAYGQSKTFSVNLTAPSVSTVTDYTLSFRMKKNSSLFGTVSDSKVIKVTPEYDTISTGNTKAISGVAEKYYKFTVTSASNYVFRTMKYSKKYDTKLYLYNSSMEEIGYNDDVYTGNRYSKIEKYLSSGTYYIYVKPYSGSTLQCYLNVDTYTEQNVTSSATVSNKYEGYYKYTVSSAGTYVFSTKKYSKDCDTYLILLDDNGEIVEKNNDSSSVYAKIETELSKGTYHIIVSSYKYVVNGENAKTYCTLTVGSKSTAPSTSESASISISTPSANEVIKTYNGNSIKISGTASNCSGVTVKVGSKTLPNVKLNGSKYEVYYTPTESGRYTITVTGNAIFGSNPSATRNVTIAVNDDSDTLNSATAINSGTERVAAIDYAGDVDCFSFTPKETGSYKIYSSGGVDLKGVLYENDKTTTIGTSYNAPESINFKLARTLEMNKTYYIKVDAESISATGKYSIIIEKIEEPNDTYFNAQWGLCNQGSVATSNGTITSKVGCDINVLPVWEYTKGEGIVVGVIDTGVSTEHEDLKANLLLPGIDTVHNTNNVFPTNEKTLYDEDGYEINTTAKGGHGTHVSGIISAVGDNKKGIIGVAPKAKILPIKALGNPFENDDRNYNISTNNALLDGIEYAVNNNADIVNMSIGGYESWNSIEETINGASNMLFVVSAGNSARNLGGNDTMYDYPAMYNCDNMIIVAAIDQNGELCDFSNYGEPTQIAAPGELILSTVPEAMGSYIFEDGTSMAAPHVSGVAALIWSYYKDLTAMQVKQRIVSENNVSYSRKLKGKVSSNGYLNAWYAFLNDSDLPRQASEETDTITETEKRKALITDLKSKTSNDRKTNEIFVKALNDDCERILQECLSEYEYEVVKQYTMTGIYMLRFASITTADEAINLLNARSDIKFAEPNYILNAK